MFLRKKKRPEEAELDKQISAMKSKDVQESLSAVTAVINICSRSPELKKTYLHTILPKLLEDRNTRVRTRAAFTLIRFLFSSSDFREDLIRYVVELLTEHKDQAMMLYAAALLGRIAAKIPADLKPYMDNIAGLLGARDQTRAYAASFALGEIGFNAPSLIDDVLPTMTQLLEKKAPLFVLSFSNIARKSPTLLKNFVPQLIAVIKSSKDLGMTWETSLLLTRLSHASPELATERVFPHFASLIDSSSHFARAVAAYMIGEIGLRHPNLIKTHIPQVTSLVTDFKAIVRTFLALSMGRLCYSVPAVAETMVPQIMKLLHDRNDMVRGAAAISLKYVAQRSPEQVESLIPELSKMVKDRNKVVRGVAAMGLRLVSYVAPGVVGTMVEGLSEGVAEGNVNVRRGAIFSLLIISNYPNPEIDTDILPEITKFLDDKDSRVKINAVNALKNIVLTNPDLVKTQVPTLLKLLDDKDVRFDVSYVLGDIMAYYQGEIRDLVLPNMVKFLEHKDQKVRNATAFSLGKVI